MFGIFSVEIQYLWGAIYGLCCIRINPMLLIHLLLCNTKTSEWISSMCNNCDDWHDLTIIYPTTAFYWNEHRPQNVNTMPVSHTILRNRNPHHKVKRVSRIKSLLKLYSDKVIGQCRSGNLWGIFEIWQLGSRGKTSTYVFAPRYAILPYHTADYNLHILDMLIYLLNKNIL